MTIKMGGASDIAPLDLVSPPVPRPQPQPQPPATTEGAITGAVPAIDAGTGTAASSGEGGTGRTDGSSSATVVAVTPAIKPSTDAVTEGSIDATSSAPTAPSSRPAVAGTGTDSSPVAVVSAEAGKPPVVITGMEANKPTVVGTATEVNKSPVAIAGAGAVKPSVTVTGTDVSKPSIVVSGTETSKPSAVISGTGTSKPSVVANRGEGGAPGRAENTGTAGLPSAATNKPQGPRETGHVTVSPNVEIRPTSAKEKSGEVAVFTAKEPVMTFVPQYPRWSAPAVPPQFPQNHYHRFIQDDIDAELDMVNLFTLPRTAPGTQIARVDDAFGAQRQAGEQLLPEKHRRSYDASDFGLTGGLFSISALNFTEASAMARTAS